MSYVALHIAALCLYVCSGVLYAANLALRTSHHIRLARIALIIGIVVHTAAIGAYCTATHISPFATGFGTLSIAAWAAALVYVPVEIFTGLTALGALGIPLDCLLLFAAFARSRPDSKVAPLRDSLITLHVLLIVVSFALFALAACCGAIYICQHSLLKHPDRRALFRRLPPLETIDSLAYHFVAFSLPLLTMGIALGIVRAVATHRAWILDPKTLVTYAAWLVYTAYLTARLAAGWRGTKANYLLLAGLAVTTALYFVPSQTHRMSQALQTPPPRSLTTRMAAGILPV